MFFVYLFLTGLVSGLLAGMGMGGGTLLIPLLTTIFGFNQKMAQGINLFAFCVMAIFVLVIHIKNKLINIKVAINFSIFAIIFCILGALLANLIKSSTLRVFFGCLLIFISIFECVEQIKKINK